MNCEEASNPYYSRYGRGYFTLAAVSRLHSCLLNTDENCQLVYLYVFWFGFINEKFIIIFLFKQHSLNSTFASAVIINMKTTFFLHTFWIFVLYKNAMIHWCLILLEDQYRTGLEELMLVLHKEVTFFNTRCIILISIMIFLLWFMLI